MSSFTDTIIVDLSSRKYEILIGFDCMDKAGQALTDISPLNNVMVITSPRIGDLYYDHLELSLKNAGANTVARHDIPDGEENKNLDQFRLAQEALAGNFPDPSSVPLIVALGGGVIGDVTGFIAGTFRRGVAFAQVPTTLLAAVDSSVGGKTGIDFANIKNLLGMFHQPCSVIIDLKTLLTLERRQFLSGMAEVIKYGVVCDATFFETIETNIDSLLSLDPDILAKVVGACCRIKAGVVKDDERDTGGKRMVFNFGHTLGHAIESASRFELLHGEAVSLGMLAATDIAIHLGICEPSVRQRLGDLLDKTGLPSSAKELKLDADVILSLMAYDKKFVAGRNRFVLPTKMGHWRSEEGIDPKLIEDVLNRYLK